MHLIDVRDVYKIYNPGENQVNALDAALLAAHRLTPMDVQSAVEKENIELPSGRVEGDNTELTIRTLGRLMSIEDFNTSLRTGIMAGSL